MYCTRVDVVAFMSQRHGAWMTRSFSLRVCIEMLELHWHAQSHEKLMRLFLLCLSVHHFPEIGNIEKSDRRRNSGVTAPIRFVSTLKRNHHIALVIIFTFPSNSVAVEKRKNNFLLTNNAPLLLSFYKYILLSSAYSYIPALYTFSLFHHDNVSTWHSLRWWLRFSSSMYPGHVSKGKPSNKWSWCGDGRCRTRRE